MRTYYDELGVSPQASGEEIREVYRNLVRLLHPDQQPDGPLKEAAEHQIKRINYVHAVLSDAEKRRRYDAESTQAAERSIPIIFHTPPPPPPPPSHRGTVAWVMAALVCGALISWLVNRDGVATPEYGEPATASAPRDVPAEKSSSASKSQPAAALKTDGVSEQRQILSLRAQLRAADEQIGLLLQDLGKSRAEAKPRHRGTGRTESAETPAPVSASSPSPPVQPTDAPVTSADRANTREEPGLPVASRRSEEQPRNRFAGVWFYARPKLQTFRKAFYPPEYIEANIVEENGAIRGRYRARYQVTDRAISPDVNFEFEGRATGSSASLPWNGGGGSKGEVQLKLISETSLEVVWSATQLGRTLGLAAGSAVLVRRADP